MTQVGKKIPSILLAALIAVAAAFAIGAVTVQESHATLLQDGTDGTYQISSYEDLVEFADIVNGTNEETQNTAACARLVANITCKGGDWVPIGKDINCSYTGRFDGNHYLIFGLSNADIGTESDYQGLFGFNSGTVKNVAIPESS